MLKDNWFILHVGYNDEEEISFLINQEPQIKAFVPKQVRLIKRKDLTLRESFRLFPNYVFVVTSLDVDAFHQLIQIKIKPIVEYLRILKHEDRYIETVSPQEKAVLSQFMNEHFEIDASEGFIENGKVIITQGPLIGYETTIVKINRHKKTADIKLTLFGSEQIMTVSLEILYKT